jgi:hypothetical protein
MVIRHRPRGTRAWTPIFHRGNFPGPAGDRILWASVRRLQAFSCWQTTLDALNNDADILRAIDALAQDVRIIGLCSDLPATTTFYANCLK